MINKEKNQMNQHPIKDMDTEMFSRTEMKELFCRRTSLFTLYCAEPEPVFYNGRCLYI
jgi:hypothetical protein